MLVLSLWLMQAALPTDCEDAVTRVLDHMPLEAQGALAAMQEADLPVLHPSMGRYIRDTYGLWAGNTALALDCMAHVMEPGRDTFHPDTVSAEIIRRAWVRARGE